MLRSISCRQTRAGGFTLLEVLMAVGILGVALVVILRAHVFNVRSLARAENRMTAFMLAENLLVEYELEGDFFAGEESGGFGDEFEGFAWERAVIPFSYEGEYFGELLRVEITVRWGETDSVSLATFVGGI